MGENLPATGADCLSVCLWRSCRLELARQDSVTFRQSVPALSPESPDQVPPARHCLSGYRPPRLAVSRRLSTLLSKLCVPVPATVASTVDSVLMGRD